MVILSLIVKRARVKALVKDKRAAIESFGTYVEVRNYILRRRILLIGYLVILLYINYCMTNIDLEFEVGGRRHK